MTQQEFDQEMALINSSYKKEVEPIESEIESRQQQIRRLKAQIYELRHQEDVLTIEVHDLMKNRNRIRADYHEKKHWFIVEHPKSSMEEVADGRAEV